MKHEPEHEQYIGKPLSECPDGTAAVIELPDGDCLMRGFSGGHYHYLKSDYTLGDRSTTWDECRVVAILKLGTPKPKTLAEEEEEYVWWVSCGEVMAFNRGNPEEVFKGARLGPITGIEIDGEMWRGNNPE